MIKYLTIIFDSILFIDIVRIVGMISFWFTFGIILYKILKNRQYGYVFLDYIKNLRFFELILVLFINFKFISILLYLFVNTFLIEYSILNDIFTLKFQVLPYNGIVYFNNNSAPSITTSVLNFIQSITDSTATLNPTISLYLSTLSTSSTISKVPANLCYNMAGVIITIAIGSGLKLAQNLPEIKGKIGTLGALISTVAIGVMGANAENNMSFILQKIEFLNNTDALALSLGFTGNSSFDLIFAIYILQKLQILFLYFIIYNAFLLYLNNKKVDLFLKKKLSLSSYNNFSKLLKYLSKSSKILIVSIFVVIVFISILNLYFLEFYVENFEGLCQLYFEYKTKNN